MLFISSAGLVVKGRTRWNSGLMLRSPRSSISPRFCPARYRTPHVLHTTCMLSWWVNIYIYNPIYNPIHTDMKTVYSTCNLTLSFSRSIQATWTLVTTRLCVSMPWPGPGTASTTQPSERCRTALCNLQMPTCCSTAAGPFKRQRSRESETSSRWAESARGLRLSS